MHISNEGIKLIKSFEGCKLQAYKDPVGVWTIGYGHIKNVYEGMLITMHEADSMFIEEIKEYEGYINKIQVVLKQYEFDALVSWVYNLGPANLISSTLLKRLKSGDFWDIPYQIRRWNKAGGIVLLGLTRRRKAEAFMFENKNWR